MTPNRGINLQARLKPNSIEKVAKELYNVNIKVYSIRLEGIRADANVFQAERITDSGTRKMPNEK